ncbi:MAG: hypothetical protein LBT05_00805, partial [Planctomycetaceae bacterium]|nr:hypothetical protein [Planctomycetaceae bacterium]
ESLFLVEFDMLFERSEFSSWRFDNGLACCASTEPKDGETTGAEQGVNICCENFVPLRYFRIR